MNLLLNFISLSGLKIEIWYLYQKKYIHKLFIWKERKTNLNTGCLQFLHLYISLFVLSAIMRVIKVHAFATEKIHKTLCYFIFNFHNNKQRKPRRALTSTLCLLLLDIFIMPIIYIRIDMPSKDNYTITNNFSYSQINSL